MRCLLLCFVLICLSVPTHAQIDSTNHTPIFITIDLSPQYPGGEEAMYTFIKKNIKYPDKAKTSNISGTVYLNFIVDETGQIINPKVVRGIGGGCDEEAIRVLKLMPKWKPGQKDGKPISVQFNLPIKFPYQ